MWRRSCPRGPTAVQRLFGRHAGWIARRPRVTLLLALAVVGLVGSGTRELVVDLGPDGQLPANSPYVVIDRAIREEFGGSNVVALAIVASRGTIWDADVLRIVREVTDDVLDAPGVIRQNVVSLSSPYVRVPVDRDGVVTIDYLMRDVPRNGREIASVRARVLAEPLFRGTLVNSEQDATLVIADFYDGSTPADIAGTVRRIIDSHEAEDVRIVASGQPLWQHAERVVTEQQQYYFLGSVGVILLMLYLAFGQLQGVVLPASTAFLSTICAMGFMGFTGIALNAWTTAVPVVVMAISAGHSAQMLKRYYEELARLGSRRMALITAVERTGTVMAAAGLMAASAFAALALLHIQTVRGFGLGVGAGILSAVGLELTFMLALRALWPGQCGGREMRQGRGAIILRPFLETLARHPRRVGLALVSLVALGALGYPRLVIESDIRTYWSEDTQVGRELRLFDRYFPGTTTLTVLLTGKPGSMRTPEAIHLMAGLEETMRKDDRIAWTSSLAALVMRTYQVFAPDVAAAGLPGDRNLLAQLLFLSESPMLEGYVNRSASHAVVRALLAGRSSEATRSVLQRLEAYVQANRPDGIRVGLAGGAGPTYLALNDHTVEGKVWSLVILVVVIFAGASLLLGTPVGGAYVVAPLVVTFLLTLGVFAWSGMAFDHAGATVAAIGIGLCADFSMYLIYRIRDEVLATRDPRLALRQALTTSGGAVLSVALAIGGGFSVYLASSYYPLRMAGVVLPLMLLTGSLTTLVFVPLLVLLGRPGFLCGRSAGVDPRADLAPVPAAGRRAGQRSA